MSSGNVKAGFFISLLIETFCARMHSRIDLSLVRILPHRRRYRKSSVKKSFRARIELEHARSTPRVN